MRIALVTDTFVPEVNGVTTVLAAMRRGLEARGHVVQVVAPAYPVAHEDPAFTHRVPSVRCPGYSAVRLSWPLRRHLGELISQFDPDIVHVVTEGPLGWFGRRYAERTGRVLVTSFHTDFPRYASRYLGAWAVGPTRRYLRWFHGRAELTQTPSEVARDELRALGLSHAVMWGCAADTALFTPERRDERRRRAMGAAGKVLVLHVGRLAVEKDVETLTASLRATHAALGDTALICVAGDGPEAKWVRGQLPFALHLGFLDRETLADLYADADLFVFPSPTETCGLVALEAMASGLPVIAANQGGAQENVQPGVTGKLVEAGDADGFTQAIFELARNPQLRGKLAGNARAFGLARDWNPELDRLVEQYEAALRSAAPAQYQRESASEAAYTAAPTHPRAHAAESPSNPRRRPAPPTTPAVDSPGSTASG
jgi:phosphatidylinositol alpha 1,6-mannosyltransferase